MTGSPMRGPMVIARCETRGASHAPPPFRKSSSSVCVGSMEASGFVEGAAAAEGSQRPLGCTPGGSAPSVEGGGGSAVVTAVTTAACVGKGRVSMPPR